MLHSRLYLLYFKRDFEIFLLAPPQVSPARHSLKFNLPSAEPVVLPLKGVKGGPWVPRGPWGQDPQWASKVPTKVGDRSSGGSMSLPGGRAFHVSLQLQVRDS